jgi:hypothetical protein
LVYSENQGTFPKTCTDSFAASAQWGGHIVNSANGPTHAARRTKHREAYHDDFKDGATSCPVCHLINVLRRIRNASAVVNRTSSLADVEGNKAVPSLVCVGLVCCIFRRTRRAPRERKVLLKGTPKTYITPVVPVRRWHRGRASVLLLCTTYVLQSYMLLLTGTL